jgi:hypothetical protein
MKFGSVSAKIFCATAAMLLATAPAYAEHWIIYAPDEAGYRYWMDSDSISNQGDYTYVTYVLGTPDSGPPAGSQGQRIGINCKTGDSLRQDDGGQWVPGAHFTDKAYLFQSLCVNRR